MLKDLLLQYHADSDYQLGKYIDDTYTKEEIVLQALIIMRDGTVRRAEEGICYNLTMLVPLLGWEVRELVVELFKGWPKHSGNPKYPVPSTYVEGAPPAIGAAMSMYYDTTDLWVGEYGELRKELLDYTIGVLSK